MTFDLSSLASPGRQQSKLEFQILREVSEADLRVLESAPPRTDNGADIKQLSERHHRLARMLGAGIKPGEAAVVCGYSASRVSILQANPAFQELLAFYGKEEEKAFLSTFEKLADLGASTISLLQDKIENSEPGDISIGELIRVAELSLDRSGNGPTSTVEQVNISLSSRLGEARKRAREVLLPTTASQVA